MAIKMVREPSDTPNINNIDDIVPMRYAYGGQNGFVIGKGTEISNTVSGLNFTVNSGRLVLQGVECDIDATGVTITIDNIATKRYYTVYLEVNLGLNTATIKSEYDTATYPSIDAGDDLTENTTGVARLPLYQFTATSGVISEVNKVVESVKYINEDFIKNVKVDDASKVNNLEIKQDENGVLKIGDIIIPQKILLWEGTLTANSTTPIISEIISQEIPNNISKIEFIVNNIVVVSKIRNNVASIAALNMQYGGFAGPGPDLYLYSLFSYPVSLNINTKTIRVNSGKRYDIVVTGSASNTFIEIPTTLTQIYGIIE